MHAKLLAGLVAGLLGLVSAALAADEELAASVNGESIRKADVENAFRRTRFASRENLAPDELKTLKDHVLLLLVEEALIRQFLDGRHIEVDDQRVENHVAQLRERLGKQGITLEQYLGDAGIDADRMRADIREIHRWITYVDSQAHEKTLRDYFARNQVAFDGSTVRASHILIRIPDGATAEQKGSARRRMESIDREISSGRAFADAARQYSDCPSKDQGGELDYFPRKFVMAEPFAAAAFATKTGQRSGIVETEFGYHLILVTDRKPGKLVRFEEVAETVKAAYAEDLRNAVLDRMRASADIRMMR